MMQTLSPYTSTAKTAEIMARYRPIAPRPEVPMSSNGGGDGDGEGSSSSSSSMTPTIRQSPYLRNVWPHLQSRPTRTRKRGRTSLGPPPPPVKRPRTLLQGLSPPFHITTSPARNLSIQGFNAPSSNCPSGFCPLPSVAGPLLDGTTATAASLVTLPLLPCASSSHMQPACIDLNRLAEIPEEKDLLAQLQNPTTSSTTNLVVSPRPIRLIGSNISIRAIKDDAVTVHDSEVQVVKKAKEVEKELESEALPAFVSDSNHKVRLVNSAYKEMVGQPECRWLESMITGDGEGFACKRICGEVVLQFQLESGHPPVQVLSSWAGFSCWARIEWETNGKKKSVNAFGEAMRLACESNDYMFTWRFHTRETSEASSNV